MNSKSTTLFLWDGKPGEFGPRNESIGEVDGLEFAFKQGGFCAKDAGIVFADEETSDTSGRRGLLPRPVGVRTVGRAVDEAAMGVERYPFDGFWGELMQYGSPADQSVVEWQSGSALLVKEPLWQFAHGSQEMIWLWNLFFPEALPVDARPLRLAFTRWAAYEFAAVGEGIYDSGSSSDGLKNGAYRLDGRNSKPPPNSLIRLYYEELRAAAAAGGVSIGSGRNLDRRGLVLDAKVDGSSGDAGGTLCFDHVIQPFRSWPGDARLYDGLRDAVLKRCGLEPPVGLPRRVVVIERGPSVLGGGRKERHWADREELRSGLAEWGRCRGFEVRFVHFGSLQPCEMVAEAAGAGVLIGVHGADLALVALQPNGAAVIGVSAKTCAGEAPDWESLREDEDRSLLGGGPMPLPSKWDVGTRERLEELRIAFAGASGCPLLSHASSSGNDRRRRYWTEGQLPGDGFLGRPGGNWFGELARQRNLLYLELQRCECMGVPAGQTVCMAGGRLNDSFSPSVRVDVDLHLVPVLELLAEEHFVHVDQS